MENRNIKNILLQNSKYFCCRALGGGGFRSHNIFCFVNLFIAWLKFKPGKIKKQDVLDFGKDLDDSLVQLQHSLTARQYRHSYHKSFYVHDPKLRHIHKACVRDRIVHQALVNILEPIFEPKFIFDSYASRKNKGTHRSVKRFQIFARKVSKNYTQNCFVLKCDIKKYFDSINYDILLRILRKTIKDKEILWLTEKVVDSFEAKPGCGLPLGNASSQIFANIYLNELDQFIKRKLRIKYYIRYNDDFVILDKNKELLDCYIPLISDFLKINLELSLHPKKVSIRKYFQGIDFLGYICMPYYILPKPKTRRRMIKRIKKRIFQFKDGLISEETLNQSIQSYLGFLTHANTPRFVQDLKNKIWFWMGE